MLLFFNLLEYFLPFYALIFNRSDSKNHLIRCMAKKVFLKYEDNGTLINTVAFIEPPSRWVGQRRMHTKGIDQNHEENLV